MRQDFVIIVSGLPRSGTSMMMQILSRGGVELLIDGHRKADISNPEGYFELEKVKQLSADSAWLSQAGGCAIKVVSPLLSKLPENLFYKVIFMRRDLDEIVFSQQKMLGKKGCEALQEQAILVSAFANHLDHVGNWMNQCDYMSCLYVDYQRVILDPIGSARALVDFLGLDLDPSKMAAAVDLTLYRTRLAEMY